METMTPKEREAYYDADATWIIRGSKDPNDPMPRHAPAWLNRADEILGNNIPHGCPKG